MVLHNPNNWHWVNKDVSPWAKDWLEKELIGVEAEEDGTKVKIDSISSMDGDVDVNQRKGKVITLFDLKLKLEFSGTFNVRIVHLHIVILSNVYPGHTGDSSSASGSITIPEVAHDTEEDEYVVCHY